MKVLFVTAWLAVVAFGMTSLWTYSLRPGVKGEASPAWPADNSIAPAADKFNLVLSLHPRCPCSSATVEELSLILAQTAPSIHVHVLLFAPAGTDQTWDETPLTESVRRLPDTTVTCDVDGRIAEQFGAMTSGDVQLFSPDGRLVFRGGITASRGHVGENAGRETIISQVKGSSCSLQETPVYGCSIRHQKPAERK